MNATLLVEEAVGGVACQTYILLYGMLLVARQVVVNTVGRGEVILCDDVLPRLFRRPVGKVEVNNVVILELGLELVRLAQLALARYYTILPRYGSTILSIIALPLVNPSTSVDGWMTAFTAASFSLISLL